MKLEGALYGAIRPERLAERLRRGFNSSLVAIAFLSGLVLDAEATAALDNAPVVPFAEGFEGLSPRLLGLCDGLCTNFAPVTTQAYSGTYSAYAADPPSIGDNRLTAEQIVAVPADATEATLSFWQQFEFEYVDGTGFDGSVLEVSIDGGTTWNDAGSHITAGAYTGTILQSDVYRNPLGGRAAWVGESEWQAVRVDLLAYRGQSLLFRLRLGTDASNSGTYGGWWVDDIEVTYRAPLTACARSWSVVNAYPNEAKDPASASAGGRLYVFGGYLGNMPTDAAYRYTPETDTWSAIAPLPEARYGASAVSDGTSIYILGGAASLDGPVTGTLWRYDPAADTYAALSSSSAETIFQGAAFVAGEDATQDLIVRIAGSTNTTNEAHTTSVLAYQVAFDRWLPLSSFPQDIGYVGAVFLDGTLYAAGGWVPGLLQSAKTYALGASRTWDDGLIADLPLPGGAVSGALYNGTWLVFAGGAALGWDPRTNNWRSLDQPPRRSFSTTVNAVGDAAYVLSVELDMPTTNLLRYVETNCATATPTPVASECLGDCGSDRSVSVADLVRGVGIALGAQPLASCPAFDADHDDNVAVNELVAAVGNALNGCPPLPD